jgi:hypothetical protein
MISLILKSPERLGIASASLGTCKQYLKAWRTEGFRSYLTYFLTRPLAVKSLVCTSVSTRPVRSVADLEIQISALNLHTVFKNLQLKHIPLRPWGRE